MMKYQLNKKEERVFWKAIAKDLSIKFNLNPDSKKWMVKDCDQISKAIKTKLFELDEKHKDWNVGFICNLHKRFDIKNNLYRILVASDFNTTNRETKQRISYFLIGKSADDYIEERNIIQLADALQLSTESNHKNKVPVKVENYWSFVEDFEDKANIIRMKLAPYYEQISIQKYLKEFEELHEQNIAFLKQGKLHQFYKIVSSIFDLSERVHFEAEQNVRMSVGYYLGSLKYSGEGKRLGVLISLYLTGNDHLDKYFVDFYKRKNKTDEDWQELFQRIK